MSVGHFAHNLSSKSRTDDVFVNLEVDFEGMPINENILKGLEACRYKRPSPIQFKAIPLGKCGFDLIVQSKSGTGKTLVFGIIALEMLQEMNRNVQVLILAPTREIAVQIYDVLTAIGCNIKDLSVHYFIGGLPIEDDIKKVKNCQIAIGAPGRIKHLIDSGHLKLKNIKLFILDEADQLMHNNFETDVDYIFNKLPKSKQVLAASATYPDSLDKFTSKYMRSPIHVHPGDDIPVLLGLKQFISIVQSHNNVIKHMQIKTDELTRIISTVPFKQCLVFFNYQTRAESISNKLNQLGWPTLFITGKQDQKQRLATIKDLKEFKFRVLLSTDLTARGIDVENVNLVVNFDVPYNGATYLHRIGRSGRYGSLGISVSIVDDKKESEDFKHMLTTIGGNEFSMLKFPDKESMPDDIWNCNVDKFEIFSSKNSNILLSKENKQNGHKVKEYKTNVCNASEESSVSDTGSLNAVKSNGISEENNKSISENETHSSEINNIENKEVINKSEYGTSVLSNDALLKNINNPEENTQNEVVMKDTVQSNIKEDHSILSDMLILSGLMEKKDRPKFNSFDSNCQSFLLKKENRNDEHVENVTEFEDSKLITMSEKTSGINESVSALTENLNEISIFTISNQTDEKQSSSVSENTLNTSKIDISSESQTDKDPVINNLDIQSEIKKEFGNTLGISEVNKCTVENANGSSSINDTFLIQSRSLSSENLNINHDLITKTTEQDKMKNGTCSSVVEDKLNSYKEISIRNSEHGIPMLPDLSTTPQSIQKEKEKQDIHLRNMSLFELSKIMVKEKNVNFMSFDSYCNSFLNKDLNRLVKEEIKISEQTCSSIDHLLNLIKEEINRICLSVRNKFQHIRTKDILKRLCSKENLLNEIYISESENKTNKEETSSATKNVSYQVNKVNERVSKELKHSNDSNKIKSTPKNTNYTSSSVHKSRYSQYEYEDNYSEEEGVDNYVHNQYSRNPGFLTYDYSNINQNYSNGNSRSYHLNYNVNSDYNSVDSENDWYDMWRRQVLHIKQYVRNTVYLREMMNMNNYY